MKRGTPGHPKTHALAAELGIERWGAVGLLECLWHFAAGYAQAGDVGRFDDAAIARALGWSGDGKRLVDALWKHGWLDRCRCHRRRVHDWPEHADQTLRRYVEKRQGFLPCYADASSVLAPDEDETSQPLPLPLPKPIAVTTPPIPPARAGGDALSKRQRLVANVEAAADYWIELGGRPSRADRRMLRDRLRSGMALQALKTSLAELVRREAAEATAPRRYSPEEQAAIRAEIEAKYPSARPSTPEGADRAPPTTSPESAAS